jgi:hypothetical protein
MNKEQKKARKELKNKTNQQLEKIDKIIDEYRYSNKIKSFTIDGNRSIITIDLSNQTIYKEYSNSSLLNNDIYDFVEDIYTLFNRKSGLEVQFVFPKDMKKEEQENIKTIFQTHYAIQYKNLKIKMDKQLILSILFIFIGFLILTGYTIYKSMNESSVFSEMFDIMAWVFVWEAVQTLFVDSLDNRKEIRMYQLLYLSQPELNK